MAADLMLGGTSAGHYSALQVAESALNHYLVCFNPQVRLYHVNCKFNPLVSLSKYYSVKLQRVSELYQWLLRYYSLYIGKEENYFITLYTFYTTVASLSLKFDMLLNGQEETVCAHKQCALRDSGRDVDGIKRMFDDFQDGHLIGILQLFEGLDQRLGGNP